MSNDERSDAPQGFDKWWIENAGKWYVDGKPPLRGWMVDVAWAAWKAAIRAAAPTTKAVEVEVIDPWVMDLVRKHGHEMTNSEIVQRFLPKRQLASPPPSSDARAEYERKNPLGGPATMFEAMASRIRAGEDYYAVLADYDLCVRNDTPASAAKFDWQEADRLDAFGVFGGRIAHYNGNWKIYLAETNSELWAFPTEAEAKAKFADAVKKSGYSDAENPLLRSESAKQDTAKVLEEALYRCADYHGDDALLDAPCIFCGYNGAGYWQHGTHAEHCRFHEIGGFDDRRSLLIAKRGAPPSPSVNEESK